MKVSRYDYRAQFRDIADDLIERIHDVLLDGSYILSDEVTAFENAFAAYTGSQHALGVNSGTDSLVLALLALDIEPGAKVVTAANTFYATVAAIRLAGASPVLVDADPETFLLDVRQVESSVGAHTRVVIPVHLYGKPAPMTDILRIAAGRLHVIEDAAQAHGARLGGRHVGTFGDAGCFSFHPSKNLAAAGDGGAVITDSAEIAGRIRVRRNLGQKEQNEHVALGINSKLDAIQALILAAKLPTLDRANESRRAIAARYRAALAGLPLRMQRADDGEEHAYHLFPIGSDRRDELLAFLRDASVDVVIRYPTPIHLQKPFSDLGYRPGDFPIAERLCRELLCLPIRADMPGEQADYVIEQVHRFFGSRP